MTKIVTIYPERLREFERVFNLFDANGDGWLTRQEITDALEVLGKRIAPRDRTNLLNQINHDDVVTRNSFMEWMALRQDLDMLADLRQIFDLIDADGSGKLSVAEFTPVVRCFNTKLSDMAIQLLVQYADLDGDNEIDFEEFIISQREGSSLKLSMAALRSFKKILLQYLQVEQFPSLVLIEVDSALGPQIHKSGSENEVLKTAAIQKQSALMRAENGIVSPDRLQVQVEPDLNLRSQKHKYAKYIENLYPILTQTADLVAQNLTQKLFPVVLSSDPSTAAGTIAGIKKAFPNQRLGVIWIDAHAALTSPYTTSSGNLHGMPVAIATGQDNPENPLNTLDEETINLWEKCKSLGLKEQANLNLEDLVYVAVRETKEVEKNLIQTHNVLNITTQKLREIGPQATAQRCLEKLADVDLIYINFNVDSMDSSISLKTGKPIPGGIFVEEASILNETLVQDPRVCCWEICEINPLLDVLNSMVENSLGIFQRVVDIVGKKQR